MKDGMVQVTAGSISGMLADLATHPLSTIKTRLQCQGAAAASGEGAAAEVLYKSTFEGMRHMIAKEGVMSLYKGVGIVVAAAAPAQAMYFAGYEAGRSLLGSSSSAIFAAGCMAQLCGSVTWVPMDVIKERLQIEGQLKTGEVYGSSWQAVKQICRHEGFMGLYRAYVIHQFVWAPFNGLYFTTYERTKKYMSDQYNSGPVVAGTVASISAGTVASVVTSPLDLVKTRLQVMLSNPTIFDYTGPVDAFFKIVKKEGVAALFDGVAARCIWLTPRISIAMVSYEYIKNVLVE